MQFRGIIAKFPGINGKFHGIINAKKNLWNQSRGLILKNENFTGQSKTPKRMSAINI